ncbi:APC family permease [Candidatus Woesearchaeota archaeon]|nr:APC family permease [Candidatus Woesearchaeota archaeon]
MLKLKREIGLFGATAYVLGVIVGAGIYVIVGKAAGITGNALWLSFLLAAFIATCTGLSYAELAAAFPFDSAEYMYTQRAMRDRRFAFGIGWVKIVTTVIASAAVSLGFGGYLSHITGINYIYCALLLIGLLTVVNLVGVRQAFSFDIFMVIVAVIGLVVVIVAGIPHIQEFSFYLDSPSGFSGILTGAALIFFAFLGFENVGNIAEEVRNPKRNLPLSLIISVLVSVVLYVLVAIIAVSVIPWDVLAHSNSPLSDVMTDILGTKAGIVMAVMALAATGSTVLGLIIAASRMIYGLAEEHSLPQVFARLSRKRRVPYVAVLSVAAVCIAFIIPGDITSVAFLTDFGALFTFLVINLAVILLRFSEPELHRPFRVPGRLGRVPVIPLLGLVTCAGLLFSFEKKVFFIGLLFILWGMLIYAVYGERKYQQYLKQHAAERRLLASGKKRRKR